jgi:hypothetical protein
LGAAIFTVIEDKDLDPRQFVEQFDIFQAVADVAGVAVKPCSLTLSAAAKKTSS